MQKKSGYSNTLTLKVIAAIPADNILHDGIATGVLILPAGI